MDWNFAQSFLPKWHKNINKDSLNATMDVNYMLNNIVQDQESYLKNYSNFPFQRKTQTFSEFPQPSGFKAFAGQNSIHFVSLSLNIPTMNSGQMFNHHCNSTMKSSHPLNPDAEEFVPNKLWSFYPSNSCKGKFSNFVPCNFNNTKNKYQSFSSVSKNDLGFSLPSEEIINATALRFMNCNINPTSCDSKNNITSMSSTPPKINKEPYCSVGVSSSFCPSSISIAITSACVSNPMLNFSSLVNSSERKCSGFSRNNDSLHKIPEITCLNCNSFSPITPKQMSNTFYSKNSSPISNCHLISASNKSEEHPLNLLSMDVSSIYSDDMKHSSEMCSSNSNEDKIDHKCCENNRHSREGGIVSQEILLRNSDSNNLTTIESQNSRDHINNGSDIEVYFESCDNDDCVSTLPSSCFDDCSLDLTCSPTSESLIPSSNDSTNTHSYVKISENPSSPPGCNIKSFIVNPSPTDNVFNDDLYDDSDYDYDIFDLDLEDCSNLGFTLGGALVIPSSSYCSNTDSCKQFDNVFSNDGESQEEALYGNGKHCKKEISDDILDANIRWEKEINQDCVPQTPSKITFCDDVVTYPIEEWARAGPWEEYARDRMRFQKRIEESEEILAPLFQPERRKLVYGRIQQVSS